ncbi:MAG: EI24 domain-containing protein, partial [Verrucomicrobiota bacterium]
MPRRSLVSQTFSGLSAYLRVPRALFRYRLWPFQLLPAAISLILSLILFAGVYFLAGSFSTWLDGLVEVPYQWLDDTINVTIGVLTFIALLAGFFFAHKHLALIILAPFLGAIAEETLKAVKGDSFIKSDLSFSQSLGRSAKINLQYIFREIIANLLFLACGIIPAIGSLLSASGMFLTQARFLGYGLMDFPLENRGLSVAESDRFARDRTGLSIGLGAGYLFLMMIPFIGW